MSKLNPEAADVDREGDEERGQDNHFVTFCVAGEMFAVQMAPVQEIIRVPSVARLPLAPAVLDGLANLRGCVLPIINLRRMFGCADVVAGSDASEDMRAVVINLGQPLGFVVDRVASVVSVEPGRIEPAEQIQSIVSADYLTGVIRAEDDSLTMVLDFARLVDREFAAIQRMAARAERGRALDADGHALDDDEAGSDELRLVSFAVAGQEYALDIAEVQEIVQVPPVITAMPNTPPHVLGVISLRRRLLPLVSLRGLFGLPMLALAEQHRIVVVALPGGGQVGLVTDAVKEVLGVPRDQVDAMPAILAEDATLAELSGICRLDSGKRLISVIATDRLLGTDGMRAALESTSRATPGAQALAEEDDMNDRNDNATSDDDDLQVVIFRLGSEEFGVPIMSVQEIVRVPETLTRVPRTPEFVEGVINLRGTVLPVIDQRKRFGMSEIERNDRQRIMVYLFGGLRTGFIVDSVAEVLRIPRAQVETAPELSDEQHRLINRVAKLDRDGRLVLLIEPAQLLQTRELGAMNGLVGDDEPVAQPAAAPLARAA